MKLITVRSDSRVTAHSTSYRRQLSPFQCIKPNEHHSEDTEEIVC